MSSPETHTAVAETLAWLDRAVIGLNLCPFARAVRAKSHIRCVLSETRDPEALLDLLCDEVRLLLATDVAQCETTLLVHPQVLTDFTDYNDFLDVAEAALESMGCEGVLQLASFHPDYQFADTDVDDVTNATNRSPYPTLHLIREASIDRAVEAFPEAESIFEANIEKLEQLGAEGWAALQAQCQQDADPRK